MLGLKSQVGGVSLESLYSHLLQCPELHPWFTSNKSWLPHGIIQAADIFFGMDNKNDVESLSMLCQMCRDGNHLTINNCQRHIERILASLSEEYKISGMSSSSIESVMNDLWNLCQNGLLSIGEQSLAAIFSLSENLFLTECETMVVKVLEEDCPTDLDRMLLLRVISGDKELFLKLWRVFVTIAEEVEPNKLLVTAYKKILRSILNMSSNPISLFPDQYQALVVVFLSDNSCEATSNNLSAIDLDNPDIKMLHLLLAIN